MCRFSVPHETIYIHILIRAQTNRKKFKYICMKIMYLARAMLTRVRDKGAIIRRLPINKTQTTQVNLILF